MNSYLTVEQPRLFKCERKNNNYFCSGNSWYTLQRSKKTDHYQRGNVNQKSNLNQPWTNYFQTSEIRTIKQKLLSETRHLLMKSYVYIAVKSYLNFKPNEDWFRWQHCLKWEHDHLLCADILFNTYRIIIYLALSLYPNFIMKHLLIFPSYRNFCKSGSI